MSSPESPEKVLHNGDLFAVWTTVRDGVCTPGWWRWTGYSLYNDDGPPWTNYEGAGDLIAIGYEIPDWGDAAETPPTDWPYMVEAVAALAVGLS